MLYFIHFYSILFYSNSACLIDMVCLRNICINTMHKGDSIFTNKNNVFNGVGLEVYCGHIHVASVLPFPLSILRPLIYTPSFNA
jgi:hypothetical protein